MTFTWQDYRQVNCFIKGIKNTPEITVFCKTHPFPPKTSNPYLTAWNWILGFCDKRFVRVQTAIHRLLFEQKHPGEVVCSSDGDHYLRGALIMFTIQQLSGGKMHCAQGAPSLLLVTQTSVSVLQKATMDIYTNKNTAVTIFTEYGSRFG